MLQQMINAGIAIITRPAVATFEEHEQNNLSWALIYTLIGAVINAILTSIAASISGANGQGGIIGAIISVLIGSIIGFFIYYGLVFILGRAFGGTGQFGELAYDIALFTVPFGIISTLLNFIPFLGAIAGLVLGLYSLYLTYLGIQAGMNVPKDKALYVMLILFAIVLVVACIFGAAFASLLSISSNP